MSSFGLAATDRMQNPIPTIVLCLLLAFNATAVRAHPKAPKASPPIKPAATRQSTPINLALPAAATWQSTPFDLALPPAAAPQLGPLDFALPPAAARQLGPLDLALPPAAVPPLSPLDLALPPVVAQPSGPVDYTLQTASEEVKGVARWVSDSGDNGGLPYLLIDKVNARVFAFNPAGQLQGGAPALLGLGHGDRLLAPNSVTMAAMSPQVRITPAGRFVSRLAIDSHGKELLVLDYDASISLHAVVKGTPAEHRAERLASPTSQDNRISFGCINVPAAFYSTIVSPAFTHTKGIVYVLPETGPASAQFGFQPAGAPAVSGAQQSSTGTSARPAQTMPARDAR